VEAYNDALVELQKDGEGRLLPQAALPLWDMEATLKELERVRKMGLTGIVMSDKPSDFGQAPLADKAWDRFYAVCQDLGLPVNFHIGSGSFEGSLDKWWHDDKTIHYPDRSLNGPLAIYTAVNNFMNNANDVMNLLLSGVLEKFPKLNFVSVESGLGWTPFLLQAIQHNWKEMMADRDLRKFKRDPLQMFVEQIYVSYWFENANNVDSFIKEFGDNNIMFQTDFPHPTSLYPGIREKVQETLGHHTEETQHKVLYKNAERVYGVPIKPVGTA
jgi:predicted TIM-barrel fold metal-dependent hydrolase